MDDSDLDLSAANILLVADTLDDYAADEPFPSRGDIMEEAASLLRALLRERQGE